MKSWKIIGMGFVLSLWQQVACQGMEGKEEFTIDQKIGQCITVGFQGTKPADEGVQAVCHLLKQDLLGGVILYGYNIVSPEQLKQLTNTIYEANPKAFIAVDQEGGLVQRLTKAKGFAGTSRRAAEIAEDYPNPDDAYEFYLSTAEELKNYHININFGPVVDLHNPESAAIGKIGRSYGDNPDVVSSYARAFVKAHREQGILTCLKHFPGHGYALKDSHLPNIVDTTDTADCKNEIAPYENLLETGDVDMVMTAHIVNRNYDPEEHPATLSSKMIPDLLRNKGYNGVVVSDDLHMGTIQKNYSFEDIVYGSINATCDLLVFSNNPAAAKGVENFTPNARISEQIIEAVKQGIQDGKIDVTRIDESYQRIMDLKERIR